jgi:hypothetical protein
MGVGSGSVFNKGGQEVDEGSGDRKERVRRMGEVQGDIRKPFIFQEYILDNLAYGPLRKINKPMHITDPDSEFQAWTRIFLFDENFVVEYKIENKLPNAVL